MPERSKMRELERLASECGAVLLDAENTRGNHIRATFACEGRTIELICANTTSDSRRAYLNNRAFLRRQLRT